MAKILMIAMSLRKDSFNKKFIKNAHRILKSESSTHEIELLSFNDYPMPVYDGDIETATGVPAPAKTLAAKILDADAIIISTPEYNGGIPGAFKNAIDWVSRVKPMPWAGKHILLIGASPGALGAIRSLAHARIPLESIGGYVFPEIMGLPRAHEAFDADDKLKDATTEERLSALLMRFTSYVVRFTS